MTIDANVVNVRGLERQVLLECGSFFPQGDQQLPPKGHPPEVRIILSDELLAPLIDILQRRLRSATASIQEPVN